MNRKVSDYIKGKYSDVKTIAINGDYTEIEELKLNGAVIRFLWLKHLKEIKNYFTDEDTIIGYVIAEYDKGKVKAEDDLWFLIKENYVAYYNSENTSVDANEPLLMYVNIENTDKIIVVKRSDQQAFEESHNIVIGNEEIADLKERFLDARFRYFKELIYGDQESAKRTILKHTI